jgi:pyruvate,orthophosphate dikinase
LSLRIEQLREFNPMLGHRGCRLALSYPDIYRMQVRAIVRAACKLVRDEGFRVEPEIMIPLVSHLKELQIIKKDLQEIIAKTMKDENVILTYTMGTMIELPRAALTANQIATEADFFSFGTNDLTQTTLGLSRDDSSRFLPEYVDRSIFEVDPFVSLDAEGVGTLIKNACDMGRQAKPNLKLGICGEHGGDPASIYLFHSYGLDYVSCSPYRIPVARLAAAHAALRKAN